MLVSETEKIDAYYQALLERNQSFVGVFYVGVKTTSVFCIATCRARKPKRQNVEFYTTFKEALDNGYRPCKVCKPTENTAVTPQQVEKAISLVRDNPKEKITDAQLNEFGIRPEVVRRWFVKNYGITFHAYQRMYRINNAFGELKNGKSATNTAFDNGYGSLSGFGYIYKKIIGSSPQKSLDHQVIVISRLTTPIGPMFVCATEKGICLLEFVDRKMLETEFKDLQKLLNATILIGENQHILKLKEQMSEYFDGRRSQFTIPLEMPGTDFQQLVWAKLCEIPCGQTTTYTGLARKVDRPDAIRAVGTANGYNRIAIVVPCHRVLGKNGSLTGYGGGLERKRWLLEYEKSITTP